MSLNQENSPLACNGENVFQVSLNFQEFEPQRSYKHGSYKKKECLHIGANREEFVHNYNLFVTVSTAKP